MKKNLLFLISVSCGWLIQANAQSLVATGADPYVRTDANNKHLVVSGGSGWINTGAVIALYGASSPVTPNTMNLVTGGASTLLLQANGNTTTRGIATASSLVASGADPYIRTNTNNKHLVLSGGSGWVTTGATIVLYGATSATLPNSITFNAGGAQRMAIEADGGVRIGSVSTPNPTGYKLYVDQGILTEKVKIALATTAQWSDHVFHQNYKLMPLEEVEQFIQQNKHLPNVPSAEEMVKQGNDLGKTDAKLLEKIEELTLYLIEMKKENETLKKEMNQMKQQWQQRR